jgi:CheY-like chemotaxis protein
MAQAVAHSAPFPLVLLDAQMPDLDGFEVVRRIRRRPELAGAVIMMLSSADLVGDGERCRALGIDAYLTKPVHQADLLAAIRTALGQRGAPGAAAAPADPRPSNAALRVLLVEDNPTNQRLTQRLLEKRGHAVTLADNGREALQVLAAGGFDVVLMDVQMPEMDGFEATAAIRAGEEGSGAHQPIVAMTAHAMKGDEARCLAAGMDAYVAKPIVTGKLFEAMNAAMRSAREDAVETRREAV